MKMKHLLPCVLVLLWAAACTPAGDDEPDYPVKDKTILIYMAANNSLYPDAVSNLAELRQGYLPEEDNLLVYYDIPNQNPKLLRLTRDKEGAPVTDTVYRFPARNAALPATLTSTLKVVSTLFPARDYGLILWSHASGWLPPGYYGTSSKSSGTKSPEDDPYAGKVKRARTLAASRSFASDNGTEMDILQMVKALPCRFEFVIFDACLMGGIEVAYQLRDSVDYVLFSPAEVLAKGFPYSEIMEPLFRSPAALQETGRLFYEYYNNQWGVDRSATVSLIKTSELENVAAAARPIFEQYRRNIPLLNMSGIQRYYRYNEHYFYDLEDFILQLAGGSPLAAEFSAALGKAVVYKAATPYFMNSFRIERYSGLSTYIPNPANSTLDTYYLQYDWNTAAGMLPLDPDPEDPDGGNGEGE